MPHTDFTEAKRIALEREIKLTLWVEKHKNALIVLMIFCFSVTSAVTGLSIGRWAGANEERADSVGEVTRLTNLLESAITQISRASTQVQESAGSLAQTADQVNDRLDTAADKLEDAVSRADAASTKAGTAAAAAKKAAAVAATKKPEPPPAPPISINRAVQNTNRMIGSHP